MFGIQTDAIVNAANKKLEAGGGVDGLMSQHCGPQLQKAKNEIAKVLPNKKLKSAQVVVTEAFSHALAGVVLHVAAPQIQAGHSPTRTQECELRLCYYNALEQAELSSSKTVTFPILGIGIYHWPQEIGTAVAIQSICGFFETHPGTCIETVYLTMMSNSVLQTCLSHTNQEDCKKDVVQLIEIGNSEALLESLEERISRYVRNQLSNYKFELPDLTLFFECLLSVMRAVHLRSTIETTVNNLKGNIKAILEQKVICPKACSASETEARTLLRMNYHVWDETQPYDGFCKMNKLYPQLWAEFVGKEINVDNLREDEPDQLVLMEREEVTEKAVAEMHPEIQLNMEALGILKRTTHIRRCGDDCVAPDTKLLCWAALIQKRLVLLEVLTLSPRKPNLALRMGILRMPAAAEMNGLMVEKTPEELEGINQVEVNLIQKNRPIQPIFNLLDKGGRKTQVKGTTGVMVVVPVPLERTFEHVAETLPSDSNLLLLVNTRYGISRIARLPKILKALKWLKEHSPFYKNIKIDEQFSFSDDQVHFDKDVVTKDTTALLSKNDDYLLTQADIEFQPIRDVQPPPVEGFALDNYFLKSHRYQPMSNDEKNVEAEAFPHLFPSGKFHFGYNRKLPLQLSKYTRSKIRNADNKFRTDVPWVCFMFAKRMQTKYIQNGSSWISQRRKELFIVE
ncbi:unnamed protein product [Caenorhabditis auriculariae]|uniref:Macro domain-containing protein n=1 Tax=Caenorhabditis auriculariae TaxID=2777116 RepID=A0A8S1HXT6_9PELO|nr:unnamed protein product [Caenorhabditis auriculariae]